MLDIVLELIQRMLCIHRIGAHMHSLGVHIINVMHSAGAHTKNVMHSAGVYI